MNTAEHIARSKRADLLSSLGAGVLGAGIAFLLPNQLALYAILSSCSVSFLTLEEFHDN